MGGGGGGGKGAEVVVGAMWRKEFLCGPKFHP